MGLLTNTQPSNWTAPASSSFVNLTATNFNIGTGILTKCLNLIPSSCIYGDHTTCVIAGNIAHTLIDSTSSIKAIRGGNTASGYYSLVAGGSSNNVAGNGASIVGGFNNTANGLRSFIGAGTNNQALSAGSVVLAGRSNTAAGNSSHIGTGTCNCANGTDSTVLAGVCNVANGGRSTIINGCINNALSAFTFIGSGYNNTASGVYSVVVGGSSNKVAGSYSFIGGGCNNYITGNYSGILGGNNNVLTHNNSFIVGSNITSIADNTLYANNMNFSGNLSAYDITAGGHFYGNGYYLSNLNPALIPANYPFCYSVGTNSIQPVTPPLVTQNNAASGICSGVLGGGCNLISNPGSYSIIVGGRGANVNSPYSVVVGGSGNNITTSSAYSFVGGGMINSVSSANVTVVGGCKNSVNTNSAYAGVVAGGNNTASGTYTVVVGGSYNNACQSWAAVVGGSNNTASGYSASVGAGDFNTVCGVNSIINGGHRNSISGGISNINGGYYNTVNGWFSGVGSGACNTVNSNFSNIVGNANVANADNTFTLGSNISANTANYTYVNNLAVGTSIPNKTLTVVGDISATGNLYVNNIDGIAIPTSLAFTGNGITSTFDISNSIPNISPASYIVTLNGASQVPGVDYNIVYTTTSPGVSTNKVVTSFVPPNGSTLSVISLNTSKFGVPDNSVTVNKLAPNAISAIAIKVTTSLSGNDIIFKSVSAASISAVAFYGNGTFLTGVSSYTTASVPANLTVTSSISAPSISAVAFYGDGSKITNLSNSSLPTTITITTSVSAPSISAVTFYGDGSKLTGLSTTALSSFTTTSNLTSTVINNAVTVGLANNITVNDIVINGTLYTYGSSTQLSSTNLVVGDPIIYFANNNLANLYDIGLVGHFNNGLYQHTGLVRNHLDSSWTLFSGLTTEPLSANTIFPVTDTTFKLDTLNANISSISVITNNLTANNVYGNNSQTVFSDGLNLLGYGINTATFNYLNGVYINTPTSTFNGASSSPIATNFPVATFKNNSTVSGYISIQNTYSGASASTDLSIFNSTGAYLDAGINSANYNGGAYSPVFTITNANDGYIYTNSSASNFALGTQSSTGDLLLFTGGSLSGTAGVGNERLRIKSGGNVGIGTSTPNRLLTVVGDISATGNVYGNTYINVLPANTTTYQILPTDSGTTIGSLNNTTGLTATITGTYPAGFQVALIQLSGSNTLGRINVNGGVNINQANGYFKTNKQYSAATLIYTGATAGWILFGDLNA